MEIRRKIFSDNDGGDKSSSGFKKALGAAALTAASMIRGYGFYYDLINGEIEKNNCSKMSENAAKVEDFMTSIVTPD